MPSNVLLEQYYSVLIEVAKTFDENTSSIKENLYPLVEKTLNTSKGKSDYKKCISKFISKRSVALYDSIPVARIIFTAEDANELFNAVNVDSSDATQAILKTYYGNEPHFSPLAAKDPFTVTQFCVIRYFLEHNNAKEAELAMIHLAFSGKFYPSIHSNFYKFPPARHTMEYVINNLLTTKFDIITEGNVIGCIRKICKTWSKTYKKKFHTFSDGNIKDLINQLQSRIRSFIKNIANVFYNVVNSGQDVYIALSSDNLEEDNYHLADSDTLRISRIVEKSINYITSTGIDYNACKKCSDENITVNEIKSIMESLFANPNNTPLVKELVSLLVITYFQQAKEKEKNVTNISFITYTISAKPNAKQKEILRQKEIINELLSDNSTSYIRRKSRNSTRNSYERAMRMYFALSIHNANR